MALRLYGCPTSTATRRVSIVLYELHLSYEFIPIDLTKGENNSPEYLEKNPFGTVPLLDDAGFLVHESHAIIFYLSLKFTDVVSLCPRFSDLEDLIIYVQVGVVHITRFLVIEPYLLERIASLKDTKAKPGDITWETEFQAFEATLDGYERILSKQKYLSSNELSSVDLVHLPMSHLLSTMGMDIMYDRTKRPNVARWFEDLTSRPSWKANEIKVTPYTEA